MNCYCDSGKIFENCCQPFLGGKAKPPTAEALMRSRYTAYAVGDAEYLIRSTHPKTRKLYDVEALKNRAEKYRWQKLEILSAEQGEMRDKKGVVEFKAHFLDENGEARIHHERSNFQTELGKWFFFDGEVFEAK